MSFKTKIAIAKPFEGKPPINLPSIIGASSKKPIFVRIATIGQRPIEYEARAFLNSPIQISSTLENITDFELSVYCNDEILAVFSNFSAKNITHTPCGF